jgi:transposase
VSDIATVTPATKKKSLHDSQRDTPRVRRLRSQFKKRRTDEWLSILRRLKFVDESGVHFGLTRLFGRARPGQRVVEATPGETGTHYTLLAALGLQGLQAPALLAGALDGSAFEVYIEQVLLPTLRRGDIVLMDNLSSHKSPHIRQWIESVGARLEFLPPYSPDLNPIELCWSKVKTSLRRAKAQTFEALLEALADAFDSVAKPDIEAWFAHCGYVKP